MKKMMMALAMLAGLVSVNAQAQATGGLLGTGSTVATVTTVVVGAVVVGTVASGLDNTGTTGTVN